MSSPRMEGSAWTLQAGELTRWGPEEKEKEDKAESNDEGPHSEVSQDAEK